MPEDELLELAVQIARLREQGAEREDVEAKAAGRALPASVRETLSSFSNDRGGTLILGLNEKQGFAATGVEDPKKVMDDLAALCSDVMEPPVRAAIQIVAFEGVSLVVAVVPEVPRPQKPCYVRDRGLYNGSFTRMGDGDRRLTQYEVGLLIGERGQPIFDAEPVPEATLEDLDQESVGRLLVRVRRRQPTAFAGVEDQIALQRLRVLVRHDDHLVPSLGGLLSFGIYPQQFFPQLQVSFVSIPATSKDLVPPDGPRFLDNQTITGSIPILVAETLRVITRNMSTRGVVTGEGRAETYEYPLEALREAVVNAVLHRDYSPGARGAQVQVEMFQDRLVIRNPGGLFGTVTEEDLGREGISSSRNGHLSSMLTDTAMPDGERLVAENRGSGIPAMLATLRRAGLTTPVFADRIGSFSVTFPKHSLLDSSTVAWLQSLGTGLTDAQCMALALMREGRTVTNASLRQLGLDSREATSALTDLVERRLARSWGGRRYAQYALDPAVSTTSETQRAKDTPTIIGKTEPGALGTRVPRDERLRQTRALLLAATRPLSASEIAVQLGVGERSVLTYLTQLIALGEVEPTAPPRSTLRRYVAAAAAGRQRR